MLTFPVWPILIIGGSALQTAHENCYKWKTWIAWDLIQTIFIGFIGLSECYKETTLHTYTMQALSTMSYTYTQFTLYMLGLNAWNSRQKANIKMSHSKSQNEPRWLMSPRLGTPGSNFAHSVYRCQKTTWAIQVKFAVYLNVNYYIKLWATKLWSQFFGASGLSPCFSRCLSNAPYCGDLMYLRLQKNLFPFCVWTLTADLFSVQPTSFLSACPLYPSASIRAILLSMLLKYFTNTSHDSLCRQHAFSISLWFTYIFLNSLDSVAPHYPPTCITVIWQTDSLVIPKDA